MYKKEKRRNKRYEVQDVHGSLLFSIDVRIINMSLDGMAIESTKRLNVGKKYTVNFFHNEETIRLTGSVVWCVLSRTMKSDKGEIVPVYRAGIQHEGILNKKADELIRFIETSVVLKLEKRLFGRFKIKPKQPVNVDCEYDFLVRTISLSGMLIETDLIPEINSSFHMEVKFGSSTIVVNGRVAHIKKFKTKEDRQLSHLGIEFVEMSQESRQLLGSFIRNELANA